MKRSVLTKVAMLALLTLATLGTSGCFWTDSAPSSYHYTRFGADRDRD